MEPLVGIERKTVRRFVHAAIELGINLDLEDVQFSDEYMLWCRAGRTTANELPWEGLGEPGSPPRRNQVLARRWGSDLR
jgi:hypothetical protein